MSASGGPTGRGTLASTPTHPHKGRRGLARLTAAIRHSARGLAEAFRHEDAFRQEQLLALVLFPAGLWLGRDGVQRALLLGSVLLVLIVELLNSAIEAVVDRISLDDHTLARRAKDLGSAAVMLSLATLTVIWLVVLLG